ncbi:hypothetical protein P692DRAFT_20379578 [Suillus brevipes Sb2]|nr:hypothetical protein P692DRAFT_20379578 [Suillus brevipes Sb2]
MIQDSIDASGNNSYRSQAACASGLFYAFSGLLSFVPCCHLASPRIISSISRMFRPFVRTLHPVQTHSPSQVVLVLNITIQYPVQFVTCSMSFP